MPSSDDLLVFITTSSLSRDGGGGDDITSPYRFLCYYHYWPATHKRARTHRPYERPIPVSVDRVDTTRGCALVLRAVTEAE